MYGFLFEESAQMQKIQIKHDIIKTGVLHMKMSLRLMGYSIEFHRMDAMEEKEIPIHEYISLNNVPLCHRDTYFKVIHGESNNVELYHQIMSCNNIHYKFNLSLFAQTKPYHKVIKEAIAFYDENRLVDAIQKMIHIQGFYKDVYPHKLEYFVLQQIEQCYVKRVALTQRNVRKLQYLLTLVSNEMRVIITHMIYFDCRRRKRMISSLRSIMKGLPLIGKEELLYNMILLHQSIYDQRFEDALHIAKQVEIECVKTNNHSRMCELIQTYIAIYSALKMKNELAQEKRRLIYYLNEYDIAKCICYQSEHYLGISAFSQHQFSIAKVYLEKLLVEKHEVHPYFIALFYQSILSYKQEKNTLFALDDKRIACLNVHQRIFARYFLYKEKQRTKRELIHYINDKIAPIMDADYVFEGNIFLQELYLLKAEEGDKNYFIEKMKHANCVILQHWREVFSNL